MCVYVGKSKSCVALIVNISISPQIAFRIFVFYTYNICYIPSLSKCIYIYIILKYKRYSYYVYTYCIQLMEFNNIGVLIEEREKERVQSEVMVV